MAVSGGKAASISKKGAGKTKATRKSKPPSKKMPEKDIAKTSKKHASRTKKLKGGKVPS